LPWATRFVEHRPRDDGDIEGGAVLDLAFDSFRRVVTKRQPAAGRALEFGADHIQHVQRGMRAQDFDFNAVMGIA